MGASKEEKSGLAGAMAGFGRMVAQEKGRREVVEMIPDIMDGLRGSHRVILFTEKVIESEGSPALATRGVLMSNLEFIEEVIGKLGENVGASFFFKMWIHKLRPSVRARTKIKDAKEKAAAAEESKKKRGKVGGVKAKGGLTQEEIEEMMASEKTRKGGE